MCEVGRLEKNFTLPIVLRMPQERLALTLLTTCFFGLVLLLMGAAAGAWGMCAAGGAALISAVLWALYQKRYEIVLEGEQVTVHAPFSNKAYFYDGMNLILRQSWTTADRRIGNAGPGLAGVAIQFRQGKKAVVTVPASWRDAKEFREAMAFLKSLPNSKTYI